MVSSDKNKEVKVRKMVEADLKTVNQIDDTLFGENRVRTWPFPFKTYWEIYGPGVNLVAEVGGQVVGFLAGNIVKQEHSHSILDLMHTIGRTGRFEKVGWIDMIGVLPAFQNRQIGRALLEDFYQECKRNKAPMRAIVRGGDERLVSFLTRLGFQRWETTVFEKE